MKQKQLGTALLAALLIVNALSIPALAAAPQTQPVVTISTFDPATCSFTVQVTIADAHPDTQIRIPVWSRDDQEDIIWYPAQYDGSTWQVIVPIANHQWRLGTYTAHAYAEANGVMTLLGGGSAVASLPMGALDIQSDADQTVLTVALSGLALPQGSPVWFRAETGKGTAKNYPAIWNGSTYSVSIPVMDHKASGEYSIEAFFGLPATKLASSSFAVTPVSSGQVISDNVDGHNGTFHIVAEASPMPQIIRMQAAVWQQPDQSDLRWYDMEKAGDRFVANIDVANHARAFGNYNVHAYATLKNGIMELAGGTTVPIEPSNYLYAQSEPDGSYTLRLTGANATDARVAIWSAAQGQDDLVWYPLEDQGGGTLTCSIDPKDHPGGRTLNAHAYSGSTFLAGISFPESKAVVGTSSLVANERLQRDAEAVYAKTGRDLRAVYEFVSHEMNYVSRDGHIVPPPGYTRQEWYAVEGFETLRGNCYSFASMFYELAKRLGYDAEYVEGEVPSVNGRWIGHGFVLITIDGNTFICDPVFQHSTTTGRNYYMQPIEKPRTTYRW